MLVVFTNDLLIGIVVDDIEGVIFVQPDAIKVPDVGFATNADYQANPAVKWLDGLYPDPENKRVVALLNLRRLITSPQMLKFETASSY